VDSYEALHGWSVRHREAYWALAIERLGLRLREPFDSVVDLSDGVEAPRWLPGAGLNIVESCFAAPAECPAILHQTEGGKLKFMSYGELEALTDRVAANLRRRGYRSGDAAEGDCHPLDARERGGRLHSGCAAARRQGVAALCQRHRSRRAPSHRAAGAGSHQPALARRR
jgi:hypothetical protein